METNKRILAKICTLKELVWPEKNDRIWECEEHDFIGYSTEKNIGEPKTKVVFVETDAVSKRDLGFRSPLKTYKINNFIIQGAILPITVLPEKINDVSRENLPPFFDVTEILEITKYIDDDLDNSNKQQKFPSDIVPKTDEIRIENWLKQLRKYSTKINFNIDQLVFFETEKIDGSSFTSYLDENNQMIVASKNKMADSNHIMYKTAIEKNISSYLLNIKTIFNLNVALQGEICGPNIQKNKYKLSNYDIFFFRMFNIDTKEFIEYQDFLMIAEKISLQIVPVLSDNFTITDISSIKNHIKGVSKINPNTKREGSVFVLNYSKSTIEYDKVKKIIKEMGLFDRLSFKAISTDYLLKNNK